MMHNFDIKLKRTEGLISVTALFLKPRTDSKFQDYNSDCESQDMPRNFQINHGCFEIHGKDYQRTSCHTY